MTETWECQPPDGRLAYTAKEQVGMDEFYSRLAHYVRHAQKGNDVLITRWGSPVARLTSCQPRLPLKGSA
jgi:prevent-host-death family protein